LRFWWVFEEGRLYTNHVYNQEVIMVVFVVLMAGWRWITLRTRWVVNQVAMGEGRETGKKMKI
jgi:hypothetical protein